MANKKGYEIDERAWEIIKKNVLDLGKYFPTPQDVKMYERQATATLEKTKVEIREKVLVDGRTDNATGTDAGKQL
ncbi:MAG: hypothetical protein IJ859_07020 [Synergistaceae bacterium]|nr:hypothetical protein [Synergistaceae bacterium]